MNKEQIVSICEEVAAAANVPFAMPVRVSGRMSRCAGTFVGTYRNGKAVPVEIRFAKKYFENSSVSEEQKRQVVLHEMAHYIVFNRTGSVHDHDEVFKETCQEIGCNIVGETVSTEDKTPEYKWAVVCQCCGRTIRLYKRKAGYAKNCKGLLSPCCHGPLEVLPYEQLK